MNDLIKSTLSQLSSAWRQVLAVHLVYVGLTLVVFAPLLGALGQVLLKRSAGIDRFLFCHRFPHCFRESGASAPTHFKLV